MKSHANSQRTRPLTSVKEGAARAIKKALAAAGRWTANTADEIATRQTETLSPAGDMPPHRRRVYAQRRPAEEIVENIIYTPAGMGVRNGRIVQRYSIRAPSVAEILGAPRMARERLAEATIFESETPATYGDWVGDFIRALVCAETIAEPIALPSALAAKPYVLRDLERLGHKHVIIEAPTLIERAHLLRKTLPSYDWTAHEVAAYRRAFNFAPAPARPGSMLYLGRYDTISESVQRQYPSEETARIVKALGGRVFDARKASPEAFAGLAGEAETVIGDQGSALFGVMQWKTRNVIELARRAWWHSANLFFAEASGVQNYAIIVIDDLDEEALAARIKEHLKAFGVITAD